MRILHVIPSYEPAWAFGGTVTATSNLCRALARQGIDISVYTTDADGKGGHLDVPLNEPVDLGGVKVWYFHCDFGIKKAFYSKSLTAKLKETISQFDLIHVSAIWQWIQINVYNVCNTAKKPYIISTHGSFNPWAWSYRAYKKKLYWNLFGKKTFSTCAALHFTSEVERENSIEVVPPFKKIPNFVVPNGIEIKNLSQQKDIRKELDISKDKSILLFIGRIHRVKGLDFILKALQKIKSKQFFLLIVGNQEDIEYVNHLKTLASQIPDSVIQHGPVPQEQVWDYYCAADLFVLPSHSENFGIVVAEAMACGLPVLISKNVGIWREVESDGAGVAVNQDVDEIAEAIKKLAGDADLLNRMKQNARKSAEERYAINNVALLMIKAYEDILAGRRSPELQWK